HEWRQRLRRADVRRTRVLVGGDQRRVLRGGRPVPQERLMRDPIGLATAKWAEHGWADAAEGMAAVTSVMRAQQIYQARVDEVLKPFGLTFARYELLMLLHFSSRGSMPIKKASERLQ